METLGQVTQTTVELFGLSLTFSPNMLIMTWVVMAFLVVLSIICTRRLSLVPGKSQGFMEIIYLFLKDITVNALGEKDGKQYLPFIIAIFLFVLFANLMGILPNIFNHVGVLIALIHNLIGTADVTITYHGITNIQVMVSESLWYHGLVAAPGFEEPTKFLGTDLALALLVFFVVQIFGIQKKGFGGYLRSFVDDPFPMTGWKHILIPINPFFYLNIVGMIANVVSHSFRLWGNIFGGGMIIVIVSYLLKSILMPVGLFAFFGIFAGIVQAFVFMMLTVTYIQLQQ